MADHHVTPLEKSVGVKKKVLGVKSFNIALTKSPKNICARCSLRALWMRRTNKIPTISTVYDYANSIALHKH